MKNLSEAAVGLAYSALLFRDVGLAAQVSQLEDRLDEMREQLELWVLRAAAETVDPSGLRGLLHLGAASEEVGDAAQQLVWLVEAEEEMHPVLEAALGETDDVVVQYPIAPGSALDGAVVGGRRSARTPASTCSRSGAAAATSTGPAGASSSRRATSCSRAVHATAVRHWPSSAATCSWKTTTPVPSSSSRRTTSQAQIRRPGRSDSAAPLLEGRRSQPHHELVRWVAGPQPEAAA